MLGRGDWDSDDEIMVCLLLCYESLVLAFAALPVAFLPHPVVYRSGFRASG